jgi:hypothetical protein
MSPSTNKPQIFFTVYCTGVMVTAYVTVGNGFLMVGDLPPAINVRCPLIHELQGAYCCSVAINSRILLCPHDAHA